MVDKNKQKAGKARWAGVAKSDRKSLGAKAAHARWSKEDAVRIAEYRGEIKLGGITLGCAVLDDGRRVLSERSVSEALSHRRHPNDYERKQQALAEGQEVLPGFMQSGIASYLPEPSLRKLAAPIRYQMAKGFGIPAVGVEATLLADVCEAYLRARDEGALSPDELPKAAAADRLMRALARVAIVALIDEATGYQVVRARDELQKLLEKYVSEEFRPWMQVFPNEFYIQLFRLRNVTMSDIRKRPPYFGKLTNDIVYDRLVPGTLNRLDEVNPQDEAGRRARRHHQHLLKEGETHLRQHLSNIVFLMKSSTSWSDFMHALDRAAPRKGAIETDSGG